MWENEKRIFKIELDYFGLEHSIFFTPRPTIYFVVRNFPKVAQPEDKYFVSVIGKFQFTVPRGNIGLLSLSRSVVCRGSLAFVAL